MQRCTPVNAQGVSGLLEFLLAGFLFIPSITFIIAILFLPDPGGVSLVLRSLVGVICFTVSALPASAILTFFLITLLILSPLLLDELFNQMTFLEIMALGWMNLAVRPITFPSLLGSRNLPGISARSNFLAGNFVLSLLAGTRHAQSLNGRHCLIFARLVALLVLLLLTGGLVVIL